MAAVALMAATGGYFVAMAAESSQRRGLLARCRLAPRALPAR